MNGRGQKGRDRLERIAALLLSLAGIAERAATRSAPIRFIVLWLLRQAEAVAADFVGMEPDASLWDDHPDIAADRRGSSPMDALALALSLRLLALVVQAVADDAARLPEQAEISAFMNRIGRIGLGLEAGALPTVELCDTS